MTLGSGSAARAERVGHVTRSPRMIGWGVPVASTAVRREAERSAVFIRRAAYFTFHGRRYPELSEVKGGGGWGIVERGSGREEEPRVEWGKPVCVCW